MQDRACFLCGQPNSRYYYVCDRCRPATTHETGCQAPLRCYCRTCKGTRRPALVELAPVEAAR